MQRARFIKYHISGAYIKYVLSGLSSLLADYATFVTLRNVFNLHLSLAVFSGMLVGLVLGFVLNKMWTFQSNAHAHKTTKQIVIFALLFAFNATFTYLFVLALRNVEIPETAGKLLAMVFITLWNFFIYKKFIFRD